MQYRKVVSGKFLTRHNRFIAEVETGGRREVVHIKNTGRCRELLLPGAEVFLSIPENTLRKTKFDLIAVNKMRPGKSPLLINMDSQIPNAAVFEWLPVSGFFSSGAVFRREVTYQRSRFDIYVEDGDRKVFIEVKGVTLENDGAAMFPDAPTQRGAKHLNELANWVKSGFEGYVVFVIQMQEIKYFTPYDLMDPSFGTALRRAAAAGVKILAMDCCVTPECMEIRHPVEIRL